MVCAGCQFTTDTRHGARVRINTGGAIVRDADLGLFVTRGLGVNVSGNVATRQGAEFGAGTVLIPPAHVGAWSIVGAGSVIARPLERDVTAVGLRPGL